MKTYIEPNTQAMPVATKDFLCQNAASPVGPQPSVVSGDIVVSSQTGTDASGAL